MKHSYLNIGVTYKRLLSIIVIIITMLSFPLHATNTYSKHNKEKEIHTGRILLVYIDSSVGDMALRETAKKLKADIIYEYKYANALALNLSENKKKTEAIKKRLLKTKGVIKVIEDKTIHSTPYNNATFNKTT